MKNQISEYKQKVNDLREKSFSDEFKNNTCLLDVEFDKLEVKVNSLLIYNKGGILGFPVDLTKQNKEILSKIVKDFNCYNELIDLEYNSEKSDNQTDLISIIAYHQEIHGEEVLYNIEDETFYYDGLED